MGSKSISSLRSSDENPSKSADESLPDEQTPLLLPAPNEILSDPENCQIPRRPQPGDSKRTDEESIDDLNNSNSHSAAKPDTSIIGIISILLLGIQFSHPKYFRALIQECHSRLFHRKCRRLNRTGNIGYYFFGNRQSRQWQLAYYHFHAGRVCHSTNGEQADFEFSIQSLKTVTPLVW